MDREVIQIIQLKDGSNLVLNTDGLEQWLQPIKDKEVAIIPGVGWSQTGRSLLLNLLGHHLSGSQLDQLVKRFESKASTELITTGFWLSKPILVRKDDGKELAVLLMDTQSVFDGNLSTDDSNRIFWICLLLSSSLIINLGSNLGEDFLTKLKPFLEYIKAVPEGCADSLVSDSMKTYLF